MRSRLSFPKHPDAGRTAASFGAHDPTETMLKLVGALAAGFARASSSSFSLQT